MVKFQDAHLDTVEDAKASGFAVFNNVPHLCIDVPDHNMTISARTSDGRRITFAFMNYKEGAAPECVDICYHDNGTSRTLSGGQDAPTFDTIVFGPANKGKDFDTRCQRAAEDKPTIVCVLMDSQETKTRRESSFAVLPKA